MMYDAIQLEYFIIVQIYFIFKYNTITLPSLIGEGGGVFELLMRYLFRMYDIFVIGYVITK